LKTVTVNNGTDKELFFADIVASLPLASRSYRLNFVVQPRKFHTHVIGEFGATPFRTIKRLHVDWGTHVQMAGEQYGPHCMALQLVSESAASFRMARDFHETYKAPLGYTEGSAVLTYRVAGEDTSRTVTFKVYGISLVRSNCKK
jgi:hypothetical protein